MEEFFRNVIFGALAVLGVILLTCLVFIIIVLFIVAIQMTNILYVAVITAVVLPLLAAIGSGIKKEE